MKHFLSILIFQNISGLALGIKSIYWLEILFNFDAIITSVSSSKKKLIKMARVAETRLRELRSFSIMYGLSKVSNRVKITRDSVINT